MSGRLSLRCEQHYGSDWTKDKGLDCSLDSEFLFFSDLPLSVKQLCK